MELKSIIKTGQILTQKGQQLIQFKATAEELRQMFYISRKSRNNPKGLERTISPTRTKKIAREANSTKRKYLFPGSLTANVPKGNKNFSWKYMRPKNEALKDIVELCFRVPVASELPKQATKIATNRNNKCGYICDGQHRLVGISRSEEADKMELNVVMFLHATRKMAYQSFVDINNLQRKVPKSLKLLVRDDIGYFKPEEERAFKIVKRLEFETDSPFHEKIGLYPGDKDRFCSSPSLYRDLKKMVCGNGCLSLYSDNNAFNNIKNYLGAWEQLHPNQWDNEDYVLCKAMGVHLMLRLFPLVHQKLFRSISSVTKLNDYKQVLEAFVGLEISLPTGDFKLDWDGETIGSYSGGKGRTELFDSILEALGWKQEDE